MGTTGQGSALRAAIMPEVGSRPEQWGSPPNAFLPTGWHLMRLGDVADILYGKARPKGKGQIPVIGSGGPFGTTDEALITHETIIIGRKGAAGSVYYAGIPCFPSDTTFYLSWKQEICVPYMYYEMLRRGLAPDHSVIPSLARNDAEAYTFLLPPLPEQRAIARALRAVQEAIQARRRELALERERKAALMQRLFTKGTRGEPTKRTEIGEMPESWRVVRLGDVAEVAYGLTVNENRRTSSNQAPYLTVANVTRGALRLDEVKQIGILDGDAENYRLKQGDVLLVEGNGNPRLLGSAAIWRDELPFVLHQNHLIRARLNQHILLPDLLMSYLNSDGGRAQLLGKAKTSSGLHSINSRLVAALQIPAPSIEEQAMIVHAARACDAKVAALEREIAINEELFRALLEELMTGRLSALPLVESSQEE